MNDDEIIEQRIVGRSVRAIAKAQGTTVAAVNAAIDRWAATAIDDKTRKTTLAFELARTIRPLIDGRWKGLVTGLARPLRTRAM